MDQPDDPDVSQPHRAAASEPEPGPRDVKPARQPADTATRTERAHDYQARVERSEAVDRAYERLAEVERGTVTPAMRRIEAEDPHRHLVGLDNRLKGVDRIVEKVASAMNERNSTADQAIATVKDAIRYTFCYPESRYADGVRADCDRLGEAGFERVQRRNSWAHDEYKGINSWWRVPGGATIFEVQFHTQASFAAKQETHWAYEKLRAPGTSKADQEAMSVYQRKISVRVPIPPGAADIPDYRYP